MKILPIIHRVVLILRKQLKANTQSLHFEPFVFVAMVYLMNCIVELKIWSIDFWKVCGAGYENENY